MQKCVFGFLVLVMQLTMYANDTTIVVQRNIQQEIDNAGLKLPAGFYAMAMADSVGRARHIVATKQGALYLRILRLTAI